jgi:glycosyltransferase involved in cell wall biosynthesis
MKTILHVIETGGPGGAETVFTQLATHAWNRQIRSLAAIPDPGWVADTLIAAGLTPLAVAIARTRPALDFGLYANLVRLIREHDVDLVQSHALGMSVYACLAGLRTRTAVVCTLHGEVDLGRQDRRRAIKLGILRLGASKIVLVSNHLRDQLLGDSRIPARLTAVVPNGVDFDLHSGGPDATLRAEFGIGRDAFLVGAIGNVRPPKAYDNLLRAAAIAVRRNPNLRFVVVGEGSGSLLEDLLRLRAGLGLQEIVHFAGFRPDATVPLRNFDAFVLASRSEGFSIATVQAMASGLPVVATKSGGPEEIVTDGEDGLLIPREDPDALAAAILRVAGDEALRRKLGKAARTTARARFSLTKMLDSYEEIYRDALGMRNPSPAR